MAHGSPTDSPHAHGHEHGPAHEDDLLAGTLDPAATQQAARESAVVVWWQLTTFLDVHGEHCTDFLDGLTTQHVDGIEPGTARHALFLTNKARIIAATVAYRVAADRVLLELDPELVDELSAHLRRFRLRSRVTIEPADLGAVTLIGPACEAWQVEGAFDTSAVFGLPARTFVGTRDEAAAHVAAATGVAAGLAHPEALDALRIELGMPALVDLAPGYMPAEVGGMDVAVSLTKGCYLGQEPVARLHYRGHANRTLRQVRLDRDLPADYFDDRDRRDDDSYLALMRADAGAGARPAGTLTSWAHAPDGEIVGLAVLRREVDAGEQLVVAGTDVHVTPVAPPPA